MLKHVREFSAWSDSGELAWDQVETVLEGMLGELAARVPEAGRVLLVPPDITRCYSGGGRIAAYLYHRLKEKVQVRIMPAVGTHRAMSGRSRKGFWERISRRRYFCIMTGQRTQ